MNLGKRLAALFVLLAAQDKVAVSVAGVIEPALQAVGRPYVLEGAVRKASGRVSITAQLSEAV